MRYELKSFVAFLVVFLFFISCNQSTTQMQKEKELSTKENELLKKENELLKKELETNEKSIKQTPANSNNKTKTEIGNFNCSPLNYNPRILSSADPNSLHPDWKDSEVGLSWTILSKKKITNDKGVFLVGELISPRGGTIENGPFFVIYSEWSCSKK